MTTTPGAGIRRTNQLGTRVSTRMTRSHPAAKVRAGIAGVASWLPEQVITSDDAERRIAEASARHGFVPRPGIILKRTGIKERRVRQAHEDASDMAVGAARVALERAGIDASELDLVIFASSSQDLIEPATSHLVSAKLGTRAMVFDVKNACNSFMNGMQVADSLIRTGQYRKVLVCTGEAPSEAVRWEIEDWAQMKRAFAGYTFGDAGAAAVLEPRSDGTGIRYMDFRAASQHWGICTLKIGGTMNPRDPEQAYFEGDGNSLRDAFLEVGPQIIMDCFQRTRTTFDDYDIVLFHQVTEPFLDVFLDASGLPEEKVVRTVDMLGNVASATLPLQLERAQLDGRVGPGSNVLWIGLGAGISLGVATTRM